MKIAVIRAEEGRVVESYEFEGSLADVVKDIARQAMDEWDPSESDFFVMRDAREITIGAEVDDDTLRELEEEGLARREDGQVKVLLQYYTISFDTELVEDENYVDRKVYVIAPLVVPTLKDELEAYAASLTSGSGQPPPGIKEL